MTIEPVAFVPPTATAADLQSGVLGMVPPPAPGFGEMVTQGLESLNKQLVASQADLQAVATGDAQNLHQVMIRLEETRLAFQLAVQVRNRLLEAYQDVMRMQV